MKYETVRYHQSAAACFSIQGEKKFWEDVGIAGHYSLGNDKALHSSGSSEMMVNEQICV